MASALVRHRSDQAISKPVLSQRFVCPAGRFDELHQQLDDGDRIQVIAHHDGNTGFDHFGFLNLLLAVAAAQKGAGTNEVEHILAERIPNVVLERITGLTTHDAGESGPPSIPWAAGAPASPSTIRGGSASSPTPPNSDDPRKRRAS